MKKRILSLALALVMLLTLAPMVSAAGPKLLSEFVPSGKLTAPKAPYLVNEPWGGGDLLTIWYNNGPEVLAMTKARSLWEASEEAWAEDAQEKFMARFGVENFYIYVETDCRIDGGAWQYTREWDEPETDPCYLEGMTNSNLVFDAHEYVDGGKVYAEFSLSWLTYIDPDNEAETTGFLRPALYTDVDEYGETRYHFDLENHTFGFRCRTKLMYWEEAGGEAKALISDWSPETSIGKNGNQKKLAAPTSIPAPTIDTFDLRVDVDADSGEQTNSVWYYLNIPESVYDGILYCCAQEGMYDPYRIQAQLRINGGEWQDSYTANEVWIFSDTRATYVSDCELKETDQVELRVRLENEELGLVSDWSNILSSKPDFVAHNWAKPELEEGAALGLIPDCLQGADLTQPITRAEFAAVSVKLYEALSGTPAEPIAVNPFTDTNDPEVLKAFNVGVTNGTSATTFEPDTLINREQAATMLTRVYKKLKLEGWTLETDGSFKEAFKALFEMPALFADDELISSWARDSVYFMNANGIVKGVGNNCFAPKLVSSGEETLNFATREQALLMSVRTVKYLG